MKYWTHYLFLFAAAKVRRISISSKHFARNHNQPMKNTAEGMPLRREVRRGRHRQYRLSYFSAGGIRWTSHCGKAMVMPAAVRAS